MSTNEYLKLSQAIKSGNATLEQWQLWANNNPKTHPARNKADRLLADARLILNMLAA